MKPFRTSTLAMAASVCLLVLAALSACGKKGPPLAPLRPVPAGVDGMRATRQGDTVRVGLTLPRANADGTEPADVAYVLVYALTGNPVRPDRQRFDADDWERFGTLIARIDVRPPAIPGESAAAIGPQAEDPRPAQGAAVTVTETLDARAQVRFVHPDSATARAAEEDPAEVDPGRRVGLTALWPSREVLLQRSYVAIPFSRRGHVGAIANPGAVPLAPAPPAVPAPEVSYTARAFSLVWSVPAEVRRPIQRPVSGERRREGWLPARPALPLLPPHAFAVYELPGPDAAADQARLLSPAPIPSSDPEYEDTRLRFGQPRCFAVRTVQVFPTGTLESPLSPATCVTPEDIFPPEPPSRLTSVGSEGGVSLIWEASPDSDLAGYVVMRGEPDGRLEPITPSPIRETTYRDTAALPNVLYVYAVVAVDEHGNRSEASNRVEDMAR